MGACLLLKHGDLEYPISAFLVQLPQDLFSSEPKKSGRQDIICICFSPSEETMVVNTNKNQLYMFTMVTDLMKVSAILPYSTAVMSGKGCIVMAQRRFL